MQRPIFGWVSIWQCFWLSYWVGRNTCSSKDVLVPMIRLTGHLRPFLYQHYIQSVTVYNTVFIMRLNASFPYSLSPYVTYANKPLIVQTNQCNIWQICNSQELLVFIFLFFKLLISTNCDACFTVKKTVTFYSLFSGETIL